MDLSDDIISGLKTRFKFKSVKGKWMQGGECPDCHRFEVFCAADEPRIVKCGRIENCGWEESVRDLLPDLFEDWSRRAPASEKNPTATADAYLWHERGFDLADLRGLYTQELIRDAKTGATSATIRFPLPNDSWWERIIDKPGRFRKKANFRWIDPKLRENNPDFGKWGGHWWAHPDCSWEALARADRIWLCEGIFDAIALRHVGLKAVSLMSVNNWPEHALQRLRRTIAAGDTPKHRPELVFAFDVGKAGVEYTRKFVKLARLEGWDATAAQVRPDGEGTKRDWNDLWLRHRDWNGDAAKAPLADDALDTYLWNGAVTIAETPREKANLIASRRKLFSFDFRHDNRLWWAHLRHDQDNPDPKLEVTELANCAFRLLYRERDEVIDETNYFLQIDFPTAQKSEKARFSAAACAASSEFKKRLMAFAGMWSGTGEQLDRLMRNQTRNLKTVEPIHFTGYSPAHKTWVLGDLAVREGRVLRINKENYFDIGQAAVKQRSSQRLLDIEYDADRIDFRWIEDIWAAWGPKGLIALAFFTMSLFAVQIRKLNKSLGFLEITGQPGSGKTTLIEVLWRAFGRVEYEGFDPNKGTVAFLARSLLSVSNLPVGLIEGKRDDETAHAKRFDYNELLTLFNGRNPRGLGSKTSGTETWEPPFLGSIYLMQNDRISAMPAVLERLMSMEVNKAEWTEATRTAAIRLERKPVEEMSGTIIHVVRQEANYLPFFFKRFDFHEDNMAARTPGLHNSRCIKCHSQLAAAVEALGNLFPDVIRPDWIAQTVKMVDHMALDRQQSSGSDHPLVTEFWEKVEYLADREDQHAWSEGNSINQSRSPETTVAVNLVQFEAKCRNAGLQIPNINDLKRHLKGSKSRKFLGNKKVNNPAGKAVSCWVFEQSAQKDAGKLL